MKIGQVFGLTFWNSSKLVLNSQVPASADGTKLGALFFFHKVLFWVNWHAKDNAKSFF
jgi:hypothetical protein